MSSLLKVRAAVCRLSLTNSLRPLSIDPIWEALEHYSGNTLREQLEYFLKQYNLLLEADKQVFSLSFVCPVLEQLQPVVDEVRGFQRRMLCLRVVHIPCSMYNL